MTKLMTLYLTFEALEKRILKIDQNLTVSKKASRQPSSKLWLEPGSTLTTEEAILALITRSANDAAVVLAEAIAGSEPRFAQLMTARAYQLGMQRSKFANASGLHDNAQLSTARDIAILCRALMMNFPKYYHYFATRKFEFRGNSIFSHNEFVASYDGADGLKTGYIDASGYNLAASAVKGNQRLISVVFGGSSANWRDKHMEKLMDYGFGRAKEVLQRRAQQEKLRRRVTFRKENKQGPPHNQQQQKSLEMRQAGISASNKQEESERSYSSAATIRPVAKPTFTTHNFEPVTPPSQIN